MNLLLDHCAGYIWKRQQDAPSLPYCLFLEKFIEPEEDCKDCEWRDG